MNSLTIYELQARMCQAIGHPTRLEILHLLRVGPMRVGDLSETLGQAQTNVSRHLSVLRNEGIVTVNRLGSCAFYQIANPKLLSVCDSMREVLLDQSRDRSRMLGAFD